MKGPILKLFVIFGMIHLTSCEGKRDRPIQGKVKREVISFAPKVTGRILEILVEEGQNLKKGDTLAVLDIPEVSAKISQAKGAVLAAKAQEKMAKTGATSQQLKQLKAKYDGLKEQYGFAKKSFARVDSMYQDSLISLQSYDEAFAKLQGAKAQFDAVSAELDEVERGTRKEKLEMASGQSSQAKGLLEEANVAYSERYVVASNDMQVESISLHPGELAMAGYAIFNGYIPKSTYFRFTVPEGKIQNYEKGKTVNVKVVYSKQEFQGKIIHVKQLNRYADITTAFPDYQMEEALYEIRVKPVDQESAKDILVNANIILE